MASTTISLVVRPRGKPEHDYPSYLPQLTLYFVQGAQSKISPSPSRLAGKSPLCRYSRELPMQPNSR